MRSGLGMAVGLAQVGGLLGLVGKRVDGHADSESDECSFLSLCDF